MRNLRILTFLLVCLQLTSLVYAQTEHYYQRHSEGWFWYVDPAPEPEEVNEKNVDEAATASSGGLPTDPREALKALQERVQYAQAKAVMNPTDSAAVRDYMQLQRQVTQRAETFANTWKKVLWQNPDLDATLKNPVNQNAIHLWNDEKNLLMSAFLEHTATEWGLWFFYRSDCSFCHRFAPVLGMFAAQHGFNVLAISQDGGSLPGFSDFVLDEGQSELVGAQVVPSVFLVKPSTMEIHPVSHGFVSASELAERIYFTLEGQTPNPLDTQFTYREARE